MAEQRKKQNTETPAQARARAKSRALLVFYCLVFVGIIVGAVFLCVFMFFKVNEVQVKGISVYTPEQIAEATGIKNGDNLVFLDTAAVEETLFTAFPYVEKVRVKKKLPSKVEISITEAVAAYSVEHGSGYVYTSRLGKILEVAAGPREGSIVVRAGEVGDNKGYISLATEELQEIFSEILTTFAGRQVGGITQIDLLDIHNLSIVYDGRITLRLGNAADLIYKINFGLQIIDSGKIEPEARGVLNLSGAKESNKAYFSLESLETPSPEAGEGPPEGGEEPAVFEDGAESGTQGVEGENDAETGEAAGDAGTEDSSQQSIRGDDIPDV